MPRIAIMQGRLLPPQGGRFQCFPTERWREEFALASAAELDAIEWIYDLQGAQANPIATDGGIAEMRALSRKNNIAVVSLCADYFMDRPFVTATQAEFIELYEHLRWLVGRCRSAGVGRIVLPFVDRSRMETVEQLSTVSKTLREALFFAAESGVELHLETSLDPATFGNFLLELPDPMIKVNYDSGNSASLGYDVRAELAAYGRRIGSVHIKDRVRGGGTVALGAGAANLPALLAGLAEISYAGDYVLQVARGRPGEELDWARQNRSYLVRELEKAKMTVRYRKPL